MRNAERNKGEKNEILEARIVYQRKKREMEEHKKTFDAKENQEDMGQEDNFTKVNESEINIIKKSNEADNQYFQSRK